MNAREINILMQHIRYISVNKLRRNQPYFLCLIMSFASHHWRKDCILNLNAEPKAAGLWIPALCGGEGAASQRRNGFQPLP